MASADRTAHGHQPEHQTGELALVPSPPARPKRTGFQSLPGELQNKIYSYCRAFMYIDIAKPETSPYAGLLSVGPPISEEFEDFYFCDNVFVFSWGCRFTCYGYHLLHKIWQPWIDNLTERQAGKIRRINVVLPMWEARIFIRDDSLVIVKFKLTRKDDLISKEDIKINFFEKLEVIDSRSREGRRLGPSDLKYLVKAVLEMQTFCCVRGRGREGRWREGALEGDLAAKDVGNSCCSLCIDDLWRMGRLSGQCWMDNRVTQQPNRLFSVD